MATRTLTDLRRDDRGAVMVEFIVAFLPLMTIFAFFMQLEHMATASLVLKHAAVVGARAAAVVANEHRNTPDAADANNGNVVQRAVEEALGPWRSSMTGLQVEVRDSSSCDDPYGMVRVEVKADYVCTVPFARITLCPNNNTHTFDTLTAAFPHQGARYQEGPGAGGCAGP